jgi:hypothetical protein
MIPSESAKKQMTCSLQRKAKNNTRAKFRSQRNFKSGGSIGKCSSHPSHTTEHSIPASSCASLARKKEQKAENFTSSKIVTKDLFKVQVPRGSLQRLKKPEEYTARVQTKIVISDKHCGRIHEVSRKTKEAERDALSPGLLSLLMCRITACKTMLFKLSRWQNKALANKTRHDVYGAPTDCSDKNQVSNMNGDAKATNSSEKFSADNHRKACHIAEKKQDRHSLLENVLTRNQKSSLIRGQTKSDQARTGTRKNFCLKMKITEHKRIRSTGVIDLERSVQRKAWLCGTVRDTVKIFAEKYFTTDSTMRWPQHMQKCLLKLFHQSCKEKEILSWKQKDEEIIRKSTSSRRQKTLKFVFLPENLNNHGTVTSFDPAINRTLELKKKHKENRKVQVHRLAVEDKRTEHKLSMIKSAETEQPPRIAKSDSIPSGFARNAQRNVQSKSTNPRQPNTERLSRTEQKRQYDVYLLDKTCSFKAIKKYHVVFASATWKLPTQPSQGAIVSGRFAKQIPRCNETGKNSAGLSTVSDRRYSGQSTHQEKKKQCWFVYLCYSLYMMWP